MDEEGQSEPNKSKVGYTTR